MDRACRIVSAVLHFGHSLKFRAAACQSGAHQRLSGRGFDGDRILLLAALRQWRRPRPKARVGVAIGQGGPGVPAIRDDAPASPATTEGRSGLTAADAAGESRSSTESRCGRSDGRCSASRSRSSRSSPARRTSEADEEPKRLEFNEWRRSETSRNGSSDSRMTNPQSTWESTEHRTLFDPKAGAKVMIEHGALGSYWAEIGGQPRGARRIASTSGRGAACSALRLASAST